MKNHQIQYESPVLQKNNSPTGGKWLSSAFCCPSQLLLLLVCQMQCIKGLIPLLLQSPVGSQSSHRKAEVQAKSLVASHFCSKQCIRQAQLPFNKSFPADLAIRHLIQPVWNDLCHQSLGPGESSHSSCDLLLPSLCPISLCFVWSLLHFCLPLTQPPSAVTQQVLPQAGYFFLRLLMLWQYLFIPNSQTHPRNSPKSSFCHHFWSPVDHLV